MIFQWIQKIQSFYSDVFDTFRPTQPAITVDLNGNYYVAYVCVNPATVRQTNVGLIDICVVKINSDGQIVWFRQQPSFDTTQDDVEPAICVNSEGQVHVTYCTGGSISGQTALINSVVIVVFKLDANGDTLWVKQSPDFNTTLNNYAPDLACDSTGNIYVTYYADDPSSPSTYYDVVNLFKLDPSGTLLWVKKTNSDEFNTDAGNYNPTIAVDDSGNCYVAYFCDGANEPASGQTNVGSYDVVVFKTDTNGNLVWIRQQPSFDTTSGEFYPSITVDQYGACYIAYQTQGQTSGQTATGTIDIAVFKIDTSGNVVWIRQQPTFNTSDTNTSPSISVDRNGILFIAYNTTGTTSGQTLTGSQDTVICQMDLDGNVTQILQQPAFNTPYENTSPSIITDLNGNCGVAYYSVNPSLTANSPSQELIIFKLRNLVCVSGDTIILMEDGSYKKIKRFNVMTLLHHIIVWLLVSRTDRSSFND